MASHITKAARKRSIERLNRAFKNRTLGAMYEGACTYSGRNGKTCVVGALFTEAQLADIKRRRLNTWTTIDELAEVIGKKNIEAVTGFEIAELMRMQNIHDYAVGTESFYDEHGRLGCLIRNLK